ncbi:MAG: bifunctional riboflavin kinase/FAD synthetase [Firmicutes bacterium]|nr:bifunctional riboflavin kinase/FAD synthetase [Bacillota bacterium]
MIVEMLEDYTGSFESPVVALGTFDGIHLGHQAVLSAARRKASLLGFPSLVFTFDRHPHPALGLSNPPLLSTLDEKLDVIKAHGMDGCVLARFDAKFASMGAGDFLREVVAGRIRASWVVAGFNYTFGRSGVGNVTLLRKAGDELGFGVEVVEPVRVDQTPVSSTWIRQLISDGRMDVVARCLGRPYSAAGVVVRGEGRGRSLGFPTANINTPAEKLLPGDGVYLARLALGPANGGRSAGCVAALGTRPTFQGSTRALEAFVLDFGGDLYGRTVRLFFVEKLRDIDKFAGPTELRDQISRDVAAAKDRLADERGQSAKRKACSFTSAG